MAIATIFFANLLLATPNGYSAFPIRNVGEGSQKSASFYDAWILAANPENANAIKEAAIKLTKASPAELENLVAKKGAKRAAKFLKMAKLSEKSFENTQPARIGNFVILPFALPEKSRLRLGMNAIVFEIVDGKLLYNPSFNDPLVALVASSNFQNAIDASKLNFKTFTKEDKEVCDNLIKNKLPILLFKNGILVSESVVKGVDEIEVAKFYRNAQDVFYSWKLDEYANFMTPFSANKFNSQFKSMSEDERKKVLGEYFQWKKHYHKVLDAGIEKLILFSRHKPQCEPYDDTAYITENNGKFAITKFGAEKSALDQFLAKYIYPKDGYFNLISQKYCNKK